MDDCDSDSVDDLLEDYYEDVAEYIRQRCHVDKQEARRRALKVFIRVRRALQGRHGEPIVDFRAWLLKMADSACP
jgi:hypothetical protein